MFLTDLSVSDHTGANQACRSTILMICVIAKLYELTSIDFLTVKVPELIDGFRPLTSRYDIMELVRVTRAMDASGSAWLDTSEVTVELTPTF